MGKRNEKELIKRLFIDIQGYYFHFFSVELMLTPTLSY